MHIYKVETLLQELVSSKNILFNFLNPPESDQADISSCFNILQELSKHILGKIKNVDNLENLSKIIQNNIISGMINRSSQMLIYVAPV